MTAVHATVLRATGLDIGALRPIVGVPSAFVPALFCAGRGDSFVRPHHAVALQRLYGGDSQLALVAGDHNSLRPPDFQERASAFLRTALRTEPDAGIPAGISPAADPLQAIAAALGFGQGQVRAVPRYTEEDAEARVVMTAMEGFGGRGSGGVAGVAGAGDDDDAMLQAALAASLLDK
jgi:hypothetical protein